MRTQSQIPAVNSDYQLTDVEWTQFPVSPQSQEPLLSGLRGAGVDFRYVTRHMELNQG